MELRYLIYKVNFMCQAAISFTDVQRLKHSHPHHLTASTKQNQNRPNASSTPPNSSLQTYLPPLLTSSSATLSTTTTTTTTTTPFRDPHPRLHPSARRLRAPVPRHSLARKPLRPAVRLAVRCPAGREVPERGVGEHVGVWVLGQSAVWDRAVCL